MKIFSWNPSTRLIAVLLLWAQVYDAHPDAAGNAFAFGTPVTLEHLEASAFAAWADGREQPVQLKKGPSHVIWTQTSQPEWDGVTFGESKISGVRHLRIGWKIPLPAGTVMVRGGGQLSALKTTAPFPGQLDVEADWLPATRLKEGHVTREEVGHEEYALWVLPPNTTTRALRFTHTSLPIDRSYAGWLGGVFVLPQRLANIAPQATASAGGNNDKAPKLINESNDGTWDAWDNEPKTNAPILSAASPAWVMLTWPKPVTLCGLNALWAGFSEAEVQAYTGSSVKHPRDAADADWQTIRTFAEIENQYPRALGVNEMNFGRDITTRAIRLRITKTIDEERAHGHLRGKNKDGRRVWLGELLALHSLGDSELASVIVAAPKAQSTHPPIPIRFNLPQEGFVTLVIDDANGSRIRNLIAETKFPSGQNTAWWDGMDDLGRDPEAYRHGVYRIPEQFVQPGTYRARGLWRKQIDLRYEFSIYNAGQPAWEIADGTGAWLANHTPPCAALFVPAARAPGGKPLVFLGSYVSEGGHGLAWVDLEGRKQGGVGWVGGNWTGAQFLARDDGPDAVTNHFAYAAASWSSEDDPNRAKEKRGEVRLTALTKDGNTPVLKYHYDPPGPPERKPAGESAWGGHLGGVAVRDGLIVFSLTKLNQLVFVDARAKKAIGTAELPNPRGLAFGIGQRKLFYALSGRKLLRFDMDHWTPTPDKIVLPAPDEVISDTAESNAEGKLQDPRQLTLDATDNIYVSDCGDRHQVRVFSGSGRFKRAIGTSGIPKAGPYDPLHMNNPDGLTIDSLNRLWVTENDFQPKRVSIWTLDGKLVRSFYGPSEYGGGGKLDPQNKTKFYYHGMEFQLDWEKGIDRLVNIYHRPAVGELELPDGYGSTGTPEQPHYVHGRKYYSQDHNSNPTGGPGVAVLWQEVDGITRPVAALGRAQDWKVLKADAFKPLWPDGVNFQSKDRQNTALFSWSDLNADGTVQTNEVQMLAAIVGSITVTPDLSFVASRVGANAMRFAPQRFTGFGAPIYDLAKGDILASGVQNPVSSGGDQALWHETGWTILTTPSAPFSPYGVAGVFKGKTRWSYPSLWPGLHASHDSPPPSFPGILIGTTRLLGDFVTPHSGDAGPLWCINGNQGNMYLFTADGLFVTELFKDVRRGPTWSMPIAQRGMLLNDLTLHDENFWPSISQTKDGLVYLIDGGRSSIVRVEGLETIRRLPDTTIVVSAEDLANARLCFFQSESERQKSQGSGVMKVQLRKTAPILDGSLDDWSEAQWVDIDKSGVAAYFDSSSKPYDVQGAVAVAGDRLYAAFRTGDANLLRNTGEMSNALFKTGGALDLMIGTDASADEKRAGPTVGDSRLLVTQVKGKIAARLYRAVVPGTKEPIPFSSPWRTITLDSVEDVGDQVRMAGANGNFEISIPLATVGLKPRDGHPIKGDVGILRGNGFQTLQRVYWANKASGITADVPSEAELTPLLWGRWNFETAQ